MTRDRYMSGFDITLTPLFCRASPAGSKPSNLPCPKEGFRPLPKPLANLWQGDVIDYGDWSPPSKLLVWFTKLSPYG